MSRVGGSVQEWTNSIQQSPWEINNCSTAQKTSSLLWNPKVHYPVHKSPPLDPLLSHLNPVHNLTPYIFKINFNIILPPTLWSLPFRFSDQNLVCMSHLYNACYISSRVSSYCAPTGIKIKLARQIFGVDTRYKSLTDVQTGYFLAANTRVISGRLWPKSRHRSSLPASRSQRKNNRPTLLAVYLQYLLS
jgi:hypothetical protein